MSQKFLKFPAPFSKNSNFAITWQKKKIAKDDVLKANCNFKISGLDLLRDLKYFEDITV